MNLGAHSAPTAPQTLPIGHRLSPSAGILVIPPSPLCSCPAAENPPTQSERARGLEYPSAAHDGHQQHDDGPGSRCHPRPAPTHRQRRHRSPPVACRAPHATCHHQTTGGAGWRPSSNSRSSAADHATANQSWSATSPRLPPTGDPSSAHPGSACDPETTAPAPTNAHHSGHVGYAPLTSTRPRTQTSAGHALGSARRPRSPGTSRPPTRRAGRSRSRSPRGSGSARGAGATAARLRRLPADQGSARSAAARVARGGSSAGCPWPAVPADARCPA